VLGSKEPIQKGLRSLRRLHWMRKRKYQIEIGIIAFKTESWAS
jgi:hypothetical protein